jgi:hypothetical protein
MSGLVGLVEWFELCVRVSVTGDVLRIKCSTETLVHFIDRPF